MTDEPLNEWLQRARTATAEEPPPGAATRWARGAREIVGWRIRARNWWAQAMVALVVALLGGAWIDRELELLTHVSVDGVEPW